MPEFRYYRASCYGGEHPIYETKPVEYRWCRRSDTFAFVYPPLTEEQATAEAERMGGVAVFVKPAEAWAEQQHGT